MDRMIDSTPANRIAAFLDNQGAGLQEVDSTEMTQVDGGFPFLALVPIVVALIGLLKKN